MTLRANPGGIELAGSGNLHGNTWHYSTRHPTDAIDAEGYFQPVQNHVIRTDRIIVFADHPDGGWSEATFIVLHSERSCVITRRRGEWLVEGLAITGNLEMIDRGDGKVDVRDITNGRTIRAGIDRLLANSLIAALQAKAPDDDKTAEDPPGTAEMREEYRRLTGQGFKFGATREQMAEKLAEARAKVAA